MALATIAILVFFFILIFSKDQHPRKMDEIPEFFDSRIEWPNCISSIYNQGSCGACYAIAVSTAFAMRYCINNNKNKIIDFSPQNLVNCLSGCKGEFPDLAWDYINKKGITTEECIPYKKRENNCDIKCDDSTVPLKKFYGGEPKFLEDEISIKKEIMANGPVTSMMNIYPDYYSYKSGIYSHSGNNEIKGFHAIVIIGWGEEDDVKYWLVRDSYGPSWGENGYMKIKIGDECGAGATAYCDEIQGNYKEEEETKNGNINNNNHTIENNYQRKLILNIYTYLFLLYLFF